MTIPSYSIAISTHVYRFEKYFKPLMNAISRMRPDVDKVIFVNGQHKKEFNQQYRKEIMHFCSLCPRTYVVMTPIVRGCSFMWNTAINFTNTDYVLNLGDDIMVNDGFFEDYENALVEKRNTGNISFRINTWGFAHFSIYRKDIYDVGYFDERLLGFGEEDGDWWWRFETTKKKVLPVVYLDKIVHLCDASPTNSEHMRVEKATGWNKYSMFNQEWLWNYKYEEMSDPSTDDPNRPSHSGYTDMGPYTHHKKFPVRLRIGAETPNYYPAEKWYRDNIDKV